ncbi:hypothetical protein HJ027_22395 [Vibrio parahaemolyticus]|nr:hypothetical protein [Vibrio parahaemolyticus]
MKTQARHGIWELQVRGFDYPVVADRLIALIGQGIDDIEQPLLKRRIAESALADDVYVRCGECGCPLIFVAASAAQAAHFRHQTTFIDDSVRACTFYTGQHVFFSSGSIMHGEGRWHMAAKHWLVSLLQASPDVMTDTIRVEKYLFSKDAERNIRRRPDIYFETGNGKFAVELARWWMDPRTVVGREQFYRKKGVNLLWLFSPACREHNQITYKLIMYGEEPGSEGKGSVLRHCNAFVLSDSARSRSDETARLWFDVDFPVFRYCPELRAVTSEIRTSAVNLAELRLAPRERLPFAVPTQENFLRQQALRRADEEERVRRARHELYLRLRSLRRQLAEPVSSAYGDCSAQLRVLQRTSLPEEYRFTRLLARRKQARLRLLEAQLEALQHDRERQQKAENLMSMDSQFRQIRQEVSEAPPGVIKRALMRLQLLRGHLLRLAAELDSAQGRTLAGEVSALIRQLEEAAERDALYLDYEPPVPGVAEFIRQMEREGVRSVQAGSSGEHRRYDELVKKCGVSDAEQQRSRLEEAYQQACDRYEEKYLRHYYPGLSQGWQPGGQYKQELLTLSGELAAEPPTEQQRVIRGMLKVMLRHFRTSVEEARIREQNLTPQDRCALHACARFLEANFQTEDGAAQTAVSLNIDN